MTSPTLQTHTHAHAHTWRFYCREMLTSGSLWDCICICSAGVSSLPPQNEGCPSKVVKSAVNPLKSKKLVFSFAVEPPPPLSLSLSHPHTDLCFSSSDFRCVTLAVMSRLTLCRICCWVKSGLYCVFIFHPWIRYNSHAAVWDMKRHVTPVYLSSSPRSLILWYRHLRASLTTPPPGHPLRLQNMHC